MKGQKRKILNLLNRLLAIMIAVLAGGCSLSGSLGVRDFKPEPVSYRPPLPERWVLSNGLTVMYIKDDELPLVSGRLFLKGGSYFESPQERGFTAAMGDQMRNGGAGELSPLELDRALEEMAASISSGYSDEYGKVSFSCLKADLDRVFKLFADVVLRPRFDVERLKLWKSRSLETIRRRVEDPGTVAGIAFKQLIYGDSVYGFVLDSSAVKRIRRIDLLRTHRKFVRPNEAILTLSGDLDREQARGLVSRYFGGWTRRSEKLGKLESARQHVDSGVYFIELPFTQATVEMGHIGVKRFPPDFMAINVFNDMFGSGGFSSRLMREVRVRSGLAYDVYGAIHPDVVRGLNLIYLQTASQNTGRAIKLSLRVLKDFIGGAVEKAALDESRRGIENSFVFNFKSAAKIIRRAALLKILDYPTDFDEKFLERLSLVTIDDIKKVANRRWNPAKFVIVVVGDTIAKESLESWLKSSHDMQGIKLRELKFDEKLLL